MSTRKAQSLPNRRKGVLPYERKHLYIFCNGETEKIYFEDICKQLRVPKATCRIIASSHNRLSLVKKVQQQCKREGITPDTYTRIFVVYDADIQPKGKESDPGTIKQQVDNAYHSCRGNTYIPIVSNECFELWILLHYVDVTTPLHRDTLMKRVKDHIPNYHKTQSPVYDLTKSLQKKAKDRASALATQHQYATHKIDFVPSRCCPFTNVHELLSAIEELI